MATLIVTHRVADFDSWLPVFDEHATSRVEHGCSSEEVFCCADDPQEVRVVMRYPSADAARSFLADPSLAAAMSHAGVISEPVAEIWDSVQTAAW